MGELIKPGDIIEKMGVDGLCRTAEDYFKSITDTTPLQIKPFHDIYEGPSLLCKLGLLLSGLRLGKSMTVLDFGAGSCWLSRYLNELSCATISVDPSVTALTIGENLFRDVPVISGSIAPPRFLVFDGHKIDLEDNSVDRLICFDAFHHVPNPGEVMAEFYRVLKPGGIAGFSEVGPKHSTSPASQHEMRSFNVLENNIVMEQITDTALKLGFSEPYFKFFANPEGEVSYGDYLRIARKGKYSKDIRRYLTTSMSDYPIFFLTKGQYRGDSRSHEGLLHELSTKQKELEVKTGESFYMEINIRNSGKSTWLYRNINDIGVVNLGIHLFSADHQLIDYDFKRFSLGGKIMPGESLTKKIEVKLTEKGTFRLVLDLVSEHICWFENNGAQPAGVTVNVN
ncbi:MAG: class I SAM-dependent methyltransferase [bacterium]|nr:class I SAM-dependent methyltransferase [bacterium]